MPFNPCLIGGWCVGKCVWSTDPYRGICEFNPLDAYVDAINNEEYDIAESIYNEYSDAIDYELFVRYLSSTETLNECEGGEL